MPNKSTTETTKASSSMSTIQQQLQTETTTKGNDLTNNTGTVDYDRASLQKVAQLSYFQLHHLSVTKKLQMRQLSKDFSSILLGINELLPSEVIRAIFELPSPNNYRFVNQYQKTASYQQIKNKADKTPIEFLCMLLVTEDIKTLPVEEIKKLNLDAMELSLSSKSVANLKDAIAVVVAAIDYDNSLNNQELTEEKRKEVAKNLSDCVESVSTKYFNLSGANLEGAKLKGNYFVNNNLEDNNFEDDDLEDDEEKKRTRLCLTKSFSVLDTAIITNNAAKVRESLMHKEFYLHEGSACISTPTRLAAQRGYWDLVKLIAAGDKNCSEVGYQFTLLDAAKENQTEVVQVLLKARNTTNTFAIDPKTGNTALHYAVLNNNPAMTEAILDKIDNHYKIEDHWALNRNKAGLTFIELAAKKNCQDLVKLIAKKIKKEKIVPYLLFYAANNNVTEVVEALLAEGASFKNFAEIDKSRLLVKAVNNNNPSLVKILIRAGASAFDEVFDRNVVRNLIPCEQALNQGKWEIVTFFVQNAKKDKVKKFLSTKNESTKNNLLLLAAKANQTEVVQALLEVRDTTSIFAADKTTENTALHYAVEHNNVAMVAALLKKGNHLLVTHLNKEGLTAIELAVHQDSWELVRCFIENSEQSLLLETMQQAVNKGDWGFVKFIANNLQQKNSNNDFINLLLLSAARANATEKVNELLKIDGAAKVCVDQKTGNTALHYAVEHNNAAMVAALLEKDPNFATERNKENLTPIQLAAQLGKRQAIIELIAKKGKSEARIFNSTNATTQEEITDGEILTRSSGLR